MRCRFLDFARDNLGTEAFSFIEEFFYGADVALQGFVTQFQKNATKCGNMLFAPGHRNGQRLVKDLAQKRIDSLALGRTPLGVAGLTFLKLRGLGRLAVADREICSLLFLCHGKISL
ncbi:MAG: hypothetical protein KGL97_07125 [Alphaproteobacteria bacterium]|nr:hypothetical protein [Alphaproteobacteria bacterium]